MLEQLQFWTHLIQNKKITQLSLQNNQISQGILNVIEEKISLNRK